MTRYFIRGKESEGYVETETLQDGFVEFVREQPLENLGLILLGHTEFFYNDAMPEDVVAIRTTIPLVKGGIWTEEQAMNFNEDICGKRII